MTNKKEKNQEIEEKESIESPEDAPETQKVAPATSKTTEDTHGGDEASKEIKDSPNSANNGEKDNQGFQDNKNQKEQQEKDYFIAKDGLNHKKERPKTTSEELQKKVEEFFETKRKKQEDFKSQNRQEYLKKYILEIIKKIAAEHAGIDKQDGCETYDKKQMLEHILKKQNYKILGDKYELKDARYVQFFIDTSGVYGCGSNIVLQELMPQVINTLEKQGYECYVAACGNGFYERDMVEDENFYTRETLEDYKAGKVNEIACPTPQTAAKMANEAEFSIILADFDGLSTICEMANLCQKDKVPYFLSTEDRYPWEDPTLHDWVDPDMCYYNPELVFDVSMYGNPTLEEYEEYQYNYDHYDDYEQDNDGYEYDD